MIDEKEFQTLLNRIKKTKSKLIFATDRDAKLTNITYKNLKSLGLSINRRDIYNGYPKGKLLLKLYRKKFTRYKKVVFVDDKKENVVNVLEHLKTIPASVDGYVLNHGKLFSLN